MIAKPKLPPKRGYIEVEINGERTYKMTDDYRRMSELSENTDTNSGGIDDLGQVASDLAASADDLATAISALDERIAALEEAKSND